jgi:hypothetical protein
MEIRINGQTADITADSEKTVGEILAGLEQWLANSGHRLSGLAIDGQNAACETASSLEKAFSRDIDTVNTLDIFTSSLTELTAQSLLRLYGDIEEYEGLDYGERPAFYDNWKKSPQALLAAEQEPELYSLCDRAFSDGVVGFQMLCAIIEERLREIEDPAAEIDSLGPLVSETCTRLADLPLDIQTGKDGRAAQTIQIFSGVTEKIFRIYKLLNNYGSGTETVTDLINGFNAAARELLTAYERRDSVLVGDLAEYEMAPRLQELYSVIGKQGIK